MMPIPAAGRTPDGNDTRVAETALAWAEIPT